MAVHAFVVVQNTDPMKIISSENVDTVSKEASNGIYHVQFRVGTFNTTPAISVTQIYNGSPGAPISCTGGSGGDTTDNAVIICIDKDYCRIKTGGSSGKGEFRSFSLIAVGN